MSKTLLLAIVLLAASVYSASAQTNSFTGTIKYAITYPGNSNTQMTAALPQSLEMQISGNKSKFEITLPNGKYTFITNGDDISVTRLVDFAEGKYYIKKTKEEFIKGEPPITIPQKETKTIAGYKCKSAEVSATDRGKVQKSTVYYSEELGKNNIYFNTNAKAIQGMMLELDYSTLGVVMHLVATEVNPGRVSNRAFEIPSGYTETTEAKLHEIRAASKKK